MKLTLLQENLKIALNHLQKAIPSKPQLPILSSVLLQAQKNSLILSATDLYFGIQTKISAQIETTGSLSLPGDIFKKLIFSLPPGEIKLDQKKQSLSLVSASSKTKLPFQTSEEYPQFPEIKGESFELSLDNLQEIDKYESFAAATDQTRPILTALLLNFQSQGLEIVGTDGFRLATLVFPHYQTEKPKQLLIPVKALNEVFRIATRLKEETIKLTVSDELKQVLISLGETKVYVRLIEGDYPPYEKIIPPDFKIQTELDGQDLTEQIKRAAVFAREASNIIEFKFHKQRLVISSASPAYGEYQGVIELSTPVNKTNEIAFNALYLLDFLNATKPEKIWFGMNESLKPAMFRPTGKDNYRYIVMPFRVNN